MKAAPCCAGGAVALASLVSRSMTLPLPRPHVRRPRVTVAAVALALALSALGGLVGARPAAANPLQASIMMDDDQLVYRNDATREAALKVMQALGVDEIRVTVLWANVALGIQQYDHRHHIRFRPADPASYPPSNWNRYDALVRSAQAKGMEVYFDVTGPGPSYAHGHAPKALRSSLAATWMPNAQQFYYFVFAVGKRYSGLYKVKGQLVPRVSTWSLWNEPNQGGWITPQWYKGIPYSPVIYRKLWLYGRQALQLTGHGRDRILLGETSPLAVSRRTLTSEIAPKIFIRELMCANAAGQPYAGAAAAKRGCSIFAKYGGAFAASGFAHHPYTKFEAPTQRDSNADVITVANINDLPTLLDQLAASTHHIAAGLPILATEDGYETNPPDPFSGIPLARQADWINQDDYLLYANPRVFGNTQFLLRDAAPLTHFRKGSRQYWSTYQSGLQFANGTPKPSFAAYTMPFMLTAAAADAAGNPQLQVWGQLRFLAHSSLGGLPQKVQVEYHPGNAPANAFVPIGTPLSETDTLRHFFTATIPSPGPGLLRLHWSVNGLNVYSRAIAVPS